MHFCGYSYRQNYKNIVLILYGNTDVRDATVINILPYHDKFSQRYGIS